MDGRSAQAAEKQLLSVPSAPMPEAATSASLVLGPGRMLPVGSSGTREMLPAWHVRSVKRPPCSLGIWLMLSVPGGPAHFSRHSDAPATCSSLRKALRYCRTKQPPGGSLEWEIRCRVEALVSSEVAGSGVGRRLKMYSTNGESLHAISRVLATEQSTSEEEGILSHGEVDTGSNGLDSCVEDFPKMGRSGHAKEEEESTFSDDGLVEGRSSDRSSSVHSDEESTGGERDKILPIKRDFCKRCCKAASRCICRLITTQVNNKTGIIILQHPLENNHHLGTARIAVVGLRNVQLISVPEDDEQTSCRWRPKVPGSKRQIADRGGKKAQFLAARAEASIKHARKLPGEPKRQMEATIQVKQERQSLEATSDNQVMKMATLGTKHLEHDLGSIAVPPWISLQPDAGLLFPSEHAVDLLPVELVSDAEDFDLPENDKSTRASARKPPSQLIVLDGTWSKAKRIFYESPWLHSLPHYRLPSGDGVSRYGIIRKEPKPGCMSTIESIVLALRTLEPETEGLGSLLDVFDFMIQDQKVCMGDKYAVLEEKVRNGLSQKTRHLK